MLTHFLPWLFLFSLSLSSSSARSEAPFSLRISCGAREDVRTPPAYTLWSKDFGYTGGTRANATQPSYITPPLSTLRYFPLSGGPNNCYNLDKIPNGHYSVRIFFGLVSQTDFFNEPLFDISIDGTQVHSLKSGWSGHDDQVFADVLVFLSGGKTSICFHSTGHGDPAIVSIEILQVDDKAYYLGPEVILRAATRLTCGTGLPKFDEDYRGDHWGGDRYWSPVKTFGQNADSIISTETSIKQTSSAPNFYPESLYQTALVSTDNQLDLTYTVEVDPNRNYSIWLHFAEIDASISGAGQRVFDVLINGDTIFENVDVFEMSGDLYTALVLNRTCSVDGRILTLILRPKEGSSVIISAVEVIEVIATEFKSSSDEVRALQKLKSTLKLPLRFGWNGDPCVPQQHPWSGVDCQLDGTSSKWVIDGLDLDNQGLKGYLPNDISILQHLQSINLSGNGIHWSIPSSMGAITSLQLLDLSYNLFNGSIPESLGNLTSLRILNLNTNRLTGEVPSSLGGRLLHRASFNFTDNPGLCGIPGLPSCRTHLSVGAKIGIVFGTCIMLLLIILCSKMWWKRRQNILRARQIAERGAPYAKARTHLSHDLQMAMHHNNNNHHHHQHHHHHHQAHSKTAAENGPSLLS